jgi:ABC-2 type transport system permease protein
VSSSSLADVRVASLRNPARELAAESPLALISSYLHGAATVAELEVRKLRHDPTELLTRAVQPALWLLIFGQAFSAIRAIPTGGISYLAFMTPGILAQSVMFISIFYGLTVIWDRDQGILQEFLVMPVPRPSFVTGEALGAGVRSLSQGLVVLCLALLLGVQLDWTVAGVIGGLLTVVVGAGLFATVSMLIAIAVKTRERFMGLGQVITMPLFFASNAIYPLQIMPGWLQVVARVNPLSYLVDLLRGYLVLGAVPNAGLDWLVLLSALVVVQLIAGLTFKSIVI